MKGSVKNKLNYVGDGKEEYNSKHRRNSGNEKLFTNMGNVVAFGKVDGSFYQMSNATIAPKKKCKKNDEEDDNKSN